MKRSPVLDEVLADGCMMPHAGTVIAAKTRKRPEYEVLRMEGIDDIEEEVKNMAQGHSWQTLTPYILYLIFSGHRI
jgi:hypothetical protein